MASEVKTNKISPATGTDVTLGDASDTFTIPASATLDVNGIIDLTGATKTGFPAGGLTDASQWRLTTDFTGDANPIASNLEEVDAPVGFGVLGSSMTESSGIFTFPSTGYWLIKFFGMFYFSPGGSSTSNKITIQTTTNNSTYAIATDGSQAIGQQYDTTSGVVEYIFDVTDTANCKCRFHVDVNNAATTTMGNTAQNETYITFVKLADT